MNKAMLTYMVMVGTVIGSGFLSGKEIVVFFSRFGYLSFLCIPIAFCLFWALFYFFLNHGGIAIRRLQKSRFSNLLNIFICIVLSAAMFAGAADLVSFTGRFLTIMIMAIIIFCCFHVIRNGMGSLEKMNLIMVPFMVVILFICLCFQFGDGPIQNVSSGFSTWGIYYAIMYVILNTANSGIVIANMGETLSVKQKRKVAFFAAFTLCAILLLANIVLLKHAYAFEQDMPLLSLFDGWQQVIMQVVILFGCVTTLFSLVYTLAGSIRVFMQRSLFVSLTSVGFPFGLSFLGFGFIVSHFYPITSVLGIFLLCDLFFIPFFKQIHERVHASGKHT